jgi:hypothetical protein
MLAAATSLASNSSKADLRQRALRHLSRRGLGPVVRRDRRRFGHGIVRQEVVKPAVVSGSSDNFRLFAHTFGAAFLFVTVFLA